VIGELHLHRHPRQQPGLLPRIRARAMTRRATGNSITEASQMDRHRTRPPYAGSGSCAKSSVTGMSVFRFSSVIQSRRAVFASAADSSLIWARSGDHADQVLREPAVHPDPEPGLRVSQPPVPVHEEFLIMCKTVLVAGQDALQRQVR
jgi:hypothetical protein